MHRKKLKNISQLLFFIKKNILLHSSIAYIYLHLRLFCLAGPSIVLQGPLRCPLRGLGQQTLSLVLQTILLGGQAVNPHVSLDVGPLMLHLFVTNLAGVVGVFVLGMAFSFFHSCRDVMLRFQVDPQ